MTLCQLLGGTLAALVAGTIVGQILRLTARSEPARQTADNINQRIAAWWALCGMTALALLLGAGAVCVLFVILSMLAQEEFLVHPRPAYPVLFACTIAQYALVLSRYHVVSSLLIPATAFLVLAAWNAPERLEPFWHRTAEQYCCLVITTYFLSFAPAILRLDIPGYTGRNSTLLYYFLLVVQGSDILQYIWGKLLGRRRIAPRISPHKTWEGFLGGILSATLLGAALYRATPFTPGQAALICAAVTLAGFGGGLTMSAIKRRRGIKDFGTLVPGHGGVLDRIDSLCFAAPVFFLLVRHFFT